jgi:hypothetical protein
MIEEKITQHDLALFEILRHPVLYAEFINNIDKTNREAEFILTWYQRDVLCDFNSYISLCMARATGKTESLSNIISQTLVLNVFPDDYIVYTVPNEAQLKPVFANLSRKFRANSFLKNFIEPKSGIKTNESIKLLNGAQLLCRIAGTSGTGVNVIGLHCPFEIVDEAGYYPFPTYRELIPTLNTWTPGYKRYSAGVPTGLRENNVLWATDQEEKQYTRHRASIFDNPRISQKEIDEYTEQYGGVDSEDYIHLALGKHGKPVYSVFDRSLMKIDDYPIMKLVLDGLDKDNRDNIGNYIDKVLAFPYLPSGAGDVFFGIDLGYTDPTAIFIMYKNKFGQLKFHGKIQLNKVSYPVQMKIIDQLDTKFKPSLIGIDVGHAGKGEVQHLIQDDEFRTKHYEKRIYPVEFSSSVELGIDSNGEEIKSKTKPFSVAVLQEYSNSHRIVYSSTDYDTITELERMTYSKNPTGEIVYKTLAIRGGQKGEDHFTAALLCASLAYYMESENYIRPKSVKLYNPGWFIGA